MSRRFGSLSFATGVIFLVACSQAEPAEPVDVPVVPATAITLIDAAELPEAVRTAALAARSGVVIAEADLKQRAGRRYYEVEGSDDDADIEFDLLETSKGWQVVEIRRDVL